MGARTYQGKERYPHLLSPIRIGNLRLKNRIIAAPSSPGMIDTNGHMTHAMQAYLETKAKGGAAVVTYGESIVHSTTGKQHNMQLQLDSYGNRQGLKECAEAIHRAGAYANIQLSHGGKYAGLASVGGDEDKEGRIAYGPSHEITPVGEVQEMPRELIYEIIESYGKGAALVKDCGFDMVQVHAAHGWLFSQFLSPVMNKRTDEFGGSLENRARFLLLALDAVRKAVGPRFPIEIRLSGDDMMKNGLGEKDCIEVAKMVDDKVDLINVSCGNHEDPEMFCRTHPSAFWPRGVNVYLAAGIKKHVKTPVACVGSLNDPAQMEHIIASGQADIVELGRALVADPEIPNKAMHDQADDITPCLRCYECFGEIVKSEMIKCTVNPIIGHELEEKYGHRAPERSKKVLIVGGGPGGMEAAIVASSRGHEVTLCEKSSVLGGNLHPAGAAYFKEDIVKLTGVLERRLKRSGAKVMLNTEVTPDLIRELNPDALIVAIGSKEWKPGFIPGIDRPNVVMAIDAEMHPEKLGRKVVIMGGGLVGGEAAISFRHEGHDVTIVEMKDKIAGEVNSFYRGGLMPQIEKAATCCVNTTVKEILPDGVRVSRDGEEFVIQADTVVCALGFRTDDQTVDALTAEVDENYIIGDCRNVGIIYHAMSQAYDAAMML